MKHLMNQMTADGRRQAIALAVVLIAIYGQSLGFPFQFDDGHSIVDNPHIRSLENVPRFFVDPSTFSADPSLMMYRPVVLTSYAVNYALSHLAPWSYHLLNTIIHLGVALVAGVVASRFLHSSTAGWMAAWLFALHPVHSEAVYYVSSRSESLAVLAVLGALALHLRAERWTPVFSAMALAMGLAAKSAAIALLPLLLLYDTLIEPGAWKRRWQRHLLLWSIAAVYILQTRSIIGKATIGAPVRSFAEQWWTQAKALAYYTHLLAVPRGLNVDHQFLISDSLFDPYVAAAAAVAVSLFVVLLRFRRNRLPLFLLLWFLAALAPASLVPLNVLVNEHRLYLAGVGLAIGLAGLVQADDRARRGLLWALPLLGLLTFHRGTAWGSTEALWQDAARKAPGMARPFIMLGEHYRSQGDDEATILNFDRALARDSTYAPAYAALGEVHARIGQMDDAIRVARRGTRVLPDSVRLWSQLAQVMRTKAESANTAAARMAAFEASAEAYEYALELTPEDADLYDNLGNTYQMLSRPLDALPYHQRAVILRPGSAVSHLNHGNALFMLGDLDGAMQAYQMATRLDPGDAGSWASLGVALQRLGWVEEAATAWRRAQQLGWQRGGA